jgi:hypothetical protein
MDRATHKDSLKILLCIFCDFIQISMDFGIPPNFLKFKRIKKERAKSGRLAGFGPQTSH